jgi:hypothetical protein
MTEYIEGRAQRLLTGGRLLLGFGPDTNAGGSARQPDQPAPPRAAPAALSEEFFFRLALAFFAFVGSSVLLVMCFGLPRPGTAALLAWQQVIMNSLISGVCGLAVLCSAVCLVALAMKFCLHVIRE